MLYLKHLDPIHSIVFAIFSKVQPKVAKESKECYQALCSDFTDVSDGMFLVQVINYKEQIEGHVDPNDNGFCVVCPPVDDCTYPVNGAM